MPLLNSWSQPLPAVSICCARVALLLATAIGAWTAPIANADLMLTQAGIDRGFQLTTFATGFPVSSLGIGPFGIDYQVGGDILVTTETGNLQRFQNVDGQDAATVPVLANFGQGHAIGLAHLDSNIYMAQNGAPARIVQLNPDGSISHTVASGIAGALGLVADPVSGHLFVSTNVNPRRILNVDPVAGTFTTFASVNVDGMCFSGDYSTLYAAWADNHLVGFDVTSGAQVFDSGLIANVGAIDGSALGYGQFAGSAYVNTRSGFVVEVNLSTMAQTIIASGGSRGDFVAADPTHNGDMLLTQTDRVMRLHGIPEPTTAALLCIGGLLAIRRRTR